MMLEFKHKFKVGDRVGIPGKPNKFGNAYPIIGKVTHASDCGRYIRIRRAGCVHFGRMSEAWRCGHSCIPKGE